MSVALLQIEVGKCLKASPKWCMPPQSKVFRAKRKRVCKTQEEGECPFGLAVPTHLARAHFEFSDNFDSHLVVLSGGILGTIDITECAVPHLLQQSKSFESWIPGNFSLGFPFLCYYSLDHRRIVVFLSVNCSSISHLLVVPSMPCSSMSSLCSDIAVVDIRSRVVRG